jgi:hypothetical protein
LRGLITRHTPPFQRVLLIESGSRKLYDSLIPGIYGTYGPQTVVHVVSCYAGSPQGLDPVTGRVYRVTDYPGAARRQLLEELRANHYTVGGMICSAEPIMTKWKWWLALNLPLKFFILNENGDYFWIDRGHWRYILHFVMFRAGLTGPDAVPTLLRLFFFPLTLTYLLGFAGWVHLRRRIRLAFSRG